VNNIIEEKEAINDKNKQERTSVLVQALNIIKSSNNELLQINIFDLKNYIFNYKLEQQYLNYLQLLNIKD
jgi:hypothetical protein